jgi:hypothetical protein
MKKLALKITPQRSTQYANMTERLAEPELLASPIGAVIAHIKPVTLAGQAYLLVSLDDGSVSSRCIEIQHILPRLGATSEAYEFFERIGDVEGPFLRPLEATFTPFLPLEIAEIRRYKGKTNEVFTKVLLNIAVFAGAFAQQNTGRLRILDPLAGGGTTLFLALSDGYDAFGIEHQKQDVETTIVFLRQYLHSIHIPFKELDERGRRSGRRYQFEIGHKGETRRFVLAHGDTRDANLHMQEVPGGPHMHAIVGDLPYGIQHFGEIADMLSTALPAWENILLPGGTLALSWNATRIERAAMLDLIEKYTHLRVRNDPPYTQFEHTVDRVIKKRDILVAVKS